MEKHTPAPWHVSEDKGFATEGGRYLAIYATNEDLEVIAHVHKDVILAHKVQDHKSNAALIAAAPDLLEALEKVRKHFTTDELFDQMGEDAECILTALHKATNIK